MSDHDEGRRSPNGLGSELVTRQELRAQLAARREHYARARAHVDDRDLTCSRCGRPAEPGSELYLEALCNRCALALGQQEVAARRAASADVCKPGGRVTAADRLAQALDRIQDDDP